MIPYQQPTQKNELSDLAGTMISTLPMAAMFTRNKYMGWAAIVFSIQAWLTESPEQKASASQPALMSVGMACELYSGEAP